MENLRNVLAGLAIVLAISGAYATSLLALVPGYERIQTDYDVIDPTECAFRKLCQTEDQGRGLCKFGGIQIFGGNSSNGKCELILFEP